MHISSNISYRQIVIAPPHTPCLGLGWWRDTSWSRSQRQSSHILCVLLDEFLVCLCHRPLPIRVDLTALAKFRSPAPPAVLSITQPALGRGFHWKPVRFPVFKCLVSRVYLPPAGYHDLLSSHTSLHGRLISCIILRRLVLSFSLCIASKERVGILTCLRSVICALV